MPNADELALADKLRLAAARGQTSVVASLRKQGAKFDVDRDGRSALHFACQNGRLETVALLLKEKIPVDTADFIGQTALQRAAGEGHREVVKELLRAGADPDKQDELGNCALHEAAWRGYSETVEVLCAAGAKLVLENAAGFAPMHLASQHGHNQTARMLLLAGCDPDVPNTYGDTALHTSCRYGHAGVARILISARCNLNLQNKNGDTPLHISAAMGRRKLTRILLEAGAERNIENKQKETPLDIAVRKEAREIADFLTHPPSVFPGPIGRGTSKPRKSTHHAKKDTDRHQRHLRRGGDRASSGGGSVGHSRRRHSSCSPVDHSRRSSKEKKRVHCTRSSCRAKKTPDSIPWSPYGCHYAPNPKEFPKPKLDSLPPQPLQKGELYYIDLAGNIRKGPVGIGTACYCSPLFRRLESRIDHDRTEFTHNLEQTKSKLSQRISALEVQTKSQLASLDQRLSLWERMRKQGSPLRPNSPTSAAAIRRDHECEHHELVMRAKSEERLHALATNRPSSAGGLPRAKSSHMIDNSTEPAKERPLYKGLMVREAPVSETGRVLFAGTAANKVRQRKARELSRTAGAKSSQQSSSSPGSSRKKYARDLEFDSSGSESEGDTQEDREEEEVEENGKQVDRLRPKEPLAEDNLMKEQDVITSKVKTTNRTADSAAPGSSIEKPCPVQRVSKKEEPPVKPTVNFKPGAEVYQMRHQEHHSSTSYLMTRAHANVRTLREKFEQQLALDELAAAQDDKEAARNALSPTAGHYRVAVAAGSPQPPTPGAVQVLPQLCSNSSAASSGLGSHSEQSSGSNCSTTPPVDAVVNVNVSRRLPPQVAINGVSKNPSLKDEHNDSGYSITRGCNGSPPFNGVGSNSNSGTPEVPDQDSNYHSSEENSLIPSEEANAKRGPAAKVPPPNWHPYQPPSGGQFWQGGHHVVPAHHHPHQHQPQFYGPGSNGIVRPPLPDYETATVKRLTKDFLKPHMAVPNQMTQPPSRPPPLAPKGTSNGMSGNNGATIAYHLQTYQQRYIQQHKQQVSPGPASSVTSGSTAGPSFQQHSMPYTRSSLV